MKRALLYVPDLSERPYLASLCCAVSAVDLVSDEIPSWRRAVTAVDVGADRSEIEVVMTDDAPLETMLEGLEDLGYPARVIEQHAVRWPS